MRTDPGWEYQAGITEENKMSISAIGSVGSYSFIDRMVMNSMNRSSKTQGQQFDLSQLASKILKKEDSNGDGVLSAGETKLDSDVFQKMDTNSDDSLTTDELLAGLQSNQTRPMGPPPPMDASQMVSKIMEEEDSDGNGVLSASETKLDSGVFKKMDTDGDGSLTTDELVAGLQNNRMRPMGPPPPMDAAQLASSIMENQDSNGDSVLSVSEAQLSSSEFNTLDTDGDGKVSIEELLAGVKARDSERASEMASMAQESALAGSASNDTFQSLLQVLAQNDASNAYGGQNWLYQMLQSSAQNFTVTA